MEIGIKLVIFFICYLSLSIFFNNLATPKKRVKTSVIWKHSIIAGIIYLIIISTLIKLKGV